MIDINLIRENPEFVKEKITLKKANQKLVDDFLVLDDQWRKDVKKRDDLKSEQKKLSLERKIDEAKELKTKIQELENEISVLENNRKNILLKFPNPPLDSVPMGKDENDNVIFREVGEKPKFDYIPKDYLFISEKLDLIDIERAAKVSGSRFGYLKKELAQLEFALVMFCFDFLIKEGFIPIIPPVIIKEEIMKGMGYVDTEKDQEERYFLETDKLYFVGTSEQSIAPMHANEIFNENDLPKRYIGFSTCFRREAGSYGKDTRGILRVHQFDKLEMISFCAKEKSNDELALLTNLEEKMMQALEIPYRVVQLCTGDISQPSAATFDIEAWMPGQNEGNGQYRETHSASNTTDFQSRRLNIKYKPANKNDLEFVHILNGTAFAIGRILIAIIENYQTKEGTIKIPKVLQKYIVKDEIK